MARLHVALALFAIDLGTPFFFPPSLTCERCVSPRTWLSLGTTLPAMLAMYPGVLSSSRRRLSSIHGIHTT